MRVFFSVITSPWTRRILPLFVAAGLIIGFWEPLLRTFGVGIALLILAVLILLWRRRLPFPLGRWNRWLGGIAFAAALLGILAFFSPDWCSGIFREDVSLEEVSLGGTWGKAIAGAWRIVGLVIVGIALVVPRSFWRFLNTLARKAVPASKKLAKGFKRSIVWLRGFYSQHPLHRILLARIRRQRPTPEREIPLPAPEARMPPGEAIPREISERPSITPPPILGEWQLPGMELLDEPSQVEFSQADIDRRARLIEEALASYGVEAEVVQKNVGPAVTQFGVEPGWDRKFREVKERDKNGNIKVRLEEVSRTRVRVERITSLANDLALTLAVPEVRIEAPVPGKSMVGIEVPNTFISVVFLREIMESTPFQKLRARSKLAIALGKGAGGESVVVDLAKMPHLLIAGTTGSGKTVCLNSIIACLLINNAPVELQFLMIDPKRVELISYNPVPHLITPVITESEKAVEILKWLNREMDNRYRKLAFVGAHNIEAYNQSSKVTKPLPYLVLVIDELADLMLAKGDEVEPLLCRLAQMGRAVGIHLVVATQRPSVDVVTGLIKANFPARISFAVASQVDSRTILDTVGAEKLLGKGDMLYQPPDAAKPKRLQGCFVSDREIERLVSFWSDQRKEQPHLAEEFTPTAEGTIEDPLLEQARALAKEHGQLSISFLQRQLRIGYTRAAQLIQLLEQEKKQE